MTFDLYETSFMEADNLLGSFGTVKQARDHVTTLLANRPYLRLDDLRLLVEFDLDRVMKGFTPTVEEKM